MDGDGAGRGRLPWTPDVLRRRLLLPFLLLLVAAVGALAAPGGGRPAPRAEDVPSATAGRPAPVVAPAAEAARALDDLLERRAAAVLGQDRGLWEATVDPDRGSAAEGAVFEELRQLPFAEWEYDVADQPVVAPDGTASAVVTLRQRLAGYDEAALVRRQRVTLRPTGAGWRLVTVRPADERAALDLWDLGRVEVVQGRHAVVLVRTPDPGGGGGQEIDDGQRSVDDGGQRSVDDGELRRLADEVDRAVMAVLASWGRADWPGRVAVLVPADGRELSAVVGAAGDGLAGVAAVTTGQQRADGGTAGDRVVLDGASFARLGPIARHVLLTHEVAHVATRAAVDAPVPAWLSEGYADHVAYAGTGVPIEVAVTDVLALVREDGPPATLPRDDAFAAAGPDAAAAYAGAHVAVRLLAEEHGEEAVAAFYRATAAAGTRAAFAELGTTERAFVRAWQAELVRLAAETGA